MKHLLIALLGLFSLQLFAQPAQPNLVQTRIVEATGEGCGEVTDCNLGRICFDVFFEIDEPGWSLQSYNIWIDYGENNEVISYMKDGSCDHENGGGTNLDALGKYRFLAAQKALKLVANQESMIHNFCLNIKDLENLIGREIGIGNNQYNLVSSANLIDQEDESNSITKLITGSPLKFRPSTLSCIKKKDYELEVVYIDFEAAQGKSGVDLKWNLSENELYDYFEVQRSTDGINFSSIGTVEAHKLMLNNTAYQFVDELPLDFNYYRLRQVNGQGIENMSDIKFVSTVNNQVYPNPFVNEVNLNLGPTGTYTLEIYSIEGQVIDTRSVSNNQALKLNKLAPGTFLLKAYDSQGIKVFAESVIKVSEN